MLLVTTFLPVVSRNLPAYIGSFHFWSPVFLLSLLLFNNQTFFKKSILLLFLYGLLMIILLPKYLYVNINSWTSQGLRIEFYSIFVAITVYYYYITNEDFEGLAKFTLTAIVFIFITGIFTILATIIDPSYSRNLAGAAYSGEEKMVAARIGGGSYGYAIAVLGMFPLLIYYFKNNNRSIFSKRNILLLVIFLLIVLIRMQFFAPILVAFGGIIFSVLGSKKIKLSVMLIITFVVLVIFVPSDVYAKTMVSISKIFNTDSNVYFKLNDMATYLVSGDYYVTGTGVRAARYPLLLKVFLEYPIFGSGASYNSSSVIGGAHLYWMYKLSTFGIFGLAFFIAFQLSKINSDIKKFDKEFAFFYILSVGSVIGLGFIKALAGRETWFMYLAVIPGMYWLPLIKKHGLYNQIMQLFR